MAKVPVALTVEWRVQFILKTGEKIGVALNFKVPPLLVLDIKSSPALTRVGVQVIVALDPPAAKI